MEFITDTEHHFLSVSSLKAVLSAPPSSGALDLSGIPLTARDMERLCAHLQRYASTLISLELGFTELTDEAFLLLLPTLASLPHLETLALNGNRLTRAILKELTDALKVRKSDINVFIQCFYYFIYSIPQMLGVSEAAYYILLFDQRNSRKVETVA